MRPQRWAPGPTLNSTPDLRHTTLCFLGTSPGIPQGRCMGYRLWIVRAQATTCLSVSGAELASSVVAHTHESPDTPDTER